jgi:hypothetical protein
MFLENYCIELGGRKRVHCENNKSLRVQYATKNKCTNLFGQNYYLLATINIYKYNLNHTAVVLILQGLAQKNGLFR